MLVVPVENDSESYTIGIDKRTGRNLWRLNRPKSANWTTPTLLEGGFKGRDLVALQSSKGVSAVDLKTGEEVWNFGAGASTTSSTCVYNLSLIHI